MRELHMVNATASTRSALAFRFASLISVLLLNSLSHGILLPLVLLAAALVVFVCHPVIWSRGLKRLVIITIVSMSPLLAIFAGADKDVALLVSARTLTGTAWIFLFSLSITYSDALAILRRAGAPILAIDLMENFLQQGSIMANEWLKRKHAMISRLGSVRGIGVSDYALLMTGGIASGFERLEKLEEAKLIRSAPDQPLAQHSEAIHLRGVKVSFNHHIEALSEVSFGLGRGEKVAVLGPSGSGKSTLLRVISGLSEISFGELKRFGDRIADKSLQSRLDSRIGFVMQDPWEQIVGMTPQDDISWGLRARGRRSDIEIEKLSQEWLATFRLSHRANDACLKLSFGERKRLALASILVLDPQILLCDEPTIGLDPKSAADVIELFETTCLERTVVWVTHEYALIPNFIDRVILLNDGKIQFDGPLKEGLKIENLKRANLA